MKDEDKTREQLLKELSELRQKIAEHELPGSPRGRTGDALMEKDERFRSLVDSAEDSIYLVDRDYRYLFMNKKHLSRLGLLGDQFMGMAFGELHSPKETKTFIEKIDRVFKTGGSGQYEYKSDRDGRFFLQTFSPVKKSDGSISAVTVVSKDISERRISEMALKESEERFRALFNQASDSIFLLKSTDEGPIIVDTNYAACSMHGYTFEELIGKPISFLEDMETSKEVREVIRRLMAGELVTYDAEHTREDGSTFPVEVSAQMIRISDRPYILAIDRDISERKRMEEELRALSLTDELTGLYNRRGLLTFAKQLFKMANRGKKGMFILYADVDNLKGINDSLGHKEGDRALVDVANVLRENYRESDIIARIGGDEFVVVPVGSTGESNEKIRDRLKKQLEIFLEKNKREYRLSMSVGLAYYDPKKPCSIDDLLTEADELMYEQKRLKKKGGQVL